MTVKDAFPLSHIETNLQKLSGTSIFSTLDSAGAFHTIPVHEEHRDYTAFNTPFGQYRFCRLPFGLANAPSSYSRLVQMALDRLPSGFALGYIDDIITPNTTNFLDIAASIYPKELPLEMSTNNHLHDCFLDLDIMVLNDKFITKIYHKVDLFGFEVISYPFPDSNIPSNIGYSTFLSQLIRYSRVCSSVDDFAFRAKLIYDKLMQRGYENKTLKKSFHFS